MEQKFTIILDKINHIINITNGILWGYVLIFLLMVAGIFFTIKTNFFQIRMLGSAFNLLKKENDSEDHHISPIQALTTSLASLIGVGSLAGMSIAISIGGPGAIFWVMVISIFSMITNAIEHILGQVYKSKFKTKLFVGGPAYYIRRGLGEKYKIFAFIISVIIIITYGFVFNSVQANTFSMSVNHLFGINKYIMAIFLSVLVTLTLIGGIKRIGTLSSIIVPIMGVIYLAMAIIVVLLHIEKIPAMFMLICKSAFGFNEMMSGSVASIFMISLMTGIKRALFSTEAGLGSTPNISASVDSDHPVEQGLLGMVGVFIVAFIICTSTAFIVLSSNLYITNKELQGINLLQESLQETLGSISSYILSFCIFTFAFTSIMGNYSYAENNMAVFTSKKSNIFILRILVVATVFFGSLSSMSFVWNLADLFVGFMIIVNVFALLKLSPIAFKVIADYQNQLKEGKNPKFKKETIKELDQDLQNVWE